MGFNSGFKGLTLGKQNTSTGCTGISNFIPNYMMCVHEHTLQKNFRRKNFINAIPVRQTQIKPRCMSVCVNEHFTVVPLMPPSALKPSFQHRIHFTNTELTVFLSRTVCHNKTLCNQFGILHNMHAFKLYTTCIKCACKSFRTAVYKYVNNYMCKMKNAQII